MEKPILCVDIGTSSMKGGLFSEEGDLLQSVRVGIVDPGTEDFRNFNPRRWEDAFQELVGRLTTPQLGGIVFSGQGPSLVSVDKEGKVLFPALLWIDGRELKINGGKSFFLPKIAWFRNEHPDLYDRTARFLSCPEYLIYHLTGEAVTVSPSKEFDPYYWEPEVLEKLNLDPSKFPPLVRPATQIGKVSREGEQAYGVPFRIPVYAGGPDYLMSLLGTATTRPGTVCDRAGTSEGINFCSEIQKEYPGLRCLPHIIPGLYTVAGMLTSTGRLFEWFRELTNQRTIPYEAMMETLLSQYPRLAKEPGKFPRFFPYAHPPAGWDFTHGIFLRLGVEHRREELGMAVVEAIGFAVRSTIELLEEAGCPIHDLRLSGGQAKNRVWNQWKADIVGKPLQVPTVKDAELVGGLCVYHVARGFSPDFTRASDSLVRFEGTIEPEPERMRFYAERYRDYKVTCQRLIATVKERTSSSSI
jgi:xylulokinase